jgi:hypothetical protein
MMEFLTFRSPIEMMTESPSTLSAEIITYSTFVFCFIHSNKNGSSHTLLLFITLLAASIVDPFCLISSQLRNYYHDHASILAWDRHVAPWQFPLFSNLAYLGSAAVWNLKLPIKVETAAVAVVCSYTFYPADQFFCKWLVYQWHDQDPLYADRNGAGTGKCVPCGSSMWVMTYSMCGSFLARCATKYYKKYYKKELVNYSKDWWLLMATCVCIFLPAHIFPIFPLLYAPIAMIYGDAALAVQLFFGGCCIWWVYKHITITTTEMSATKSDVAKGWLIAAGIIWFGGLTAVGVLIDPANVRSYSIHQPYGGKGVQESPLCQEKETYLFGLPGAVRKKYQCEEDFRFWKLCDDEAPPKPGDDTYALCGTKGDTYFWTEYFTAIGIGVGLHILCHMSSRRSTSKKNV